MDTIVKDFGFFVEACHVPSVQNVIRLLGMEPAHLAPLAPLHKFLHNALTKEIQHQG